MTRCDHPEARTADPVMESIHHLLEINQAVPSSGVGVLGGGDAAIIIFQTHKFSVIEGWRVLKVVKISVLCNAMFQLCLITGLVLAGARPTLTLKEFQ